MSPGTIILIAVAAFVLLIVAAIVYRRMPKKLHAEKFLGDWKELQSYCRDKSTWAQAIIDADKLLDKALKRRKFKGKRMGERMVSAQRMISNNDQLWFAHNLAKKVVANPAMKLKEADVKTALIGFRLALKDLGALRPTETPDSPDVEAKQ
jgi:hypothetical protein